MQLSPLHVLTLKEVNSLVLEVKAVMSMAARPIPELSYTHLVNNGDLVIPPKEFTAKITELEKILRNIDIGCNRIMEKLISNKLLMILCLLSWTTKLNGNTSNRESMLELNIFIRKNYNNRDIRVKSLTNVKNK